MAETLGKIELVVIRLKNTRLSRTEIHHDFSISHLGCVNISGHRIKPCGIDKIHGKRHGFAHIIGSEVGDEIVVSSVIAATYGTQLEISSCRFRFSTGFYGVFIHAHYDCRALSLQ